MALEKVGRVRIASVFLLLYLCERSEKERETRAKSDLADADARAQTRCQMPRGGALPRVLFTSIMIPIDPTFSAESD